MTSELTHSFRQHDDHVFTWALWLAARDDWTPAEWALILDLTH